MSALTTKRQSFIGWSCAISCLAICGAAPLASAYLSHEPTKDRLAPSASISVELIDLQTERGAFKVHNSTPFIVIIYDSGVRIGWIKPFRDATFSGLKSGTHKIFAHSQYGSNSWGPLAVEIPGKWNIESPLDAPSNDMNVALASRIFNTNKTSLVTCERIAEKRGENVNGLRIEFQVDVNAAGHGLVMVKGDNIGQQLNGCYRAVITQWKYPITGSSYSLTFFHTARGSSVRM